MIEPRSSKALTAETQNTQRNRKAYHRGHREHRECKEHREGPKSAPTRLTARNLEFRAMRDANGLAVARGRDNGGHLTDHGQNEPLVVIGEAGGIFLDVGEETDLFFGKLAEHLASLAVLRCVCAGEKIRQANFHGLGDLRERLKRRDGVAVLDARKIAAEKTSAAFDITLRQASIAPVGPDDLANVYLRFLFGHGISFYNTAILRVTSEGRKKIIG
jgi:hypothetical protein